MAGTRRSPLILSALQPGDAARAAQVLRSGGVVALPFKGIFALFGDTDWPASHDQIRSLKGRPPDKRLALVTLPECAFELADFSRTAQSERCIRSLWQDVQGLGLILPATQHAHDLTAAMQPTDGTVLLVWSEYPPLRRILEAFRGLGGTALFGTSANLSGEPTASTVREVWQSFALRGGLDALVADDFSDLPASRRQSTSIVDLTGRQPRLHRLGSVPPVELQRVLRLNGFPPLQVGRGAFRLTA